MKSKTVISALLAMTLITGGAAFGQGRDDHNDRGRNDQSQRRDQRGDRQDRRDNHDRGQKEWRDNERGAGPNHNFRRGERLPREYRNRQYVVDDWRDHHLSAPPRGYHWVQTGGDYVLVAIATGVIMQLLLSR